MDIQQEIFNIVYSGLRAQDFHRSQDIWGRCAYRARAGLKCAVGHLIPDKNYNPELENKNIFSFEVLSAIPIAYRKQQNMLSLLQNIHDGNSSPDDMRFELNAFARRHNLKVPK